ncbi:MAG: TRAP transporter permease [Betaproteobacteria bacterium]|nr:TRAP transporter permease [Betaproteobacteria bacterium]
MADTAPQIVEERIEYNEVKEASMFETVLRDRGARLPVVIAVVCAVFAIALALFHLYTAVYGTPETRSFRATHLTVMLVLALLLNPLFRRSYRDPLVNPDGRGNALRVSGLLIDLVLVGFGLFVQGYTLWDIDGFNMRGGDITPLDLWVGLGFILLVLEATRRVVGWAMVFVTGFFVVHSLYSNYFFGFLYGPPTSFRKYIDVIFMRADGIFGIPLMVVATYILLFIIFGALLIRSGAGRFFIDLAIALTGHRTGGPAKAAVVASAMMGTVSGSAVANVVTTGAFTIPLMKRLGYRARFAAAVEACASSGGQITPPIMGAAAFIIAEFLRVNLLVVIVAATIPAILYYATVYFMVHMEAEKHGLVRIPKEKLPSFGAVLKRGWHLLFSLVVLITLLAIGYSAMMSAFWGIVTIVTLSFINSNTRMSSVDLFAALEGGVRSTIPVTIACACAGIIIGSVFVSGLGLKFTQSVIDLSGGYLLVLLALTAFASILLGMGLTTTAVYITLAALIIPSLEQMGVTPIAAHLFAFYYGVVSTITPPVALASFAAAAIAGSPPMSTALESAKVGIAKYLVPFIFVYNPTLLFEGPLWLTAFSFLTALAGVWALSAAIEGWLCGRLNVALRGVLMGCAILLLYPPQLTLLGLSGYLVTIVGGACVALLYFARYRARGTLVPAGG